MNKTYFLNLRYVGCFKDLLSRKLSGGDFANGIDFSLRFAKFLKFSKSKLTLINTFPIAFILCWLSFAVNAQNQLTQSFRFENGVYQTFEAFQQNRPTHTGNMIDGNFFINEKTKQAKVEYIRLKGTGKKLNLDEIWGVVIRGIPYVKTSPNLPAHNLKVFASMEVRGSICYYAYDDIEEKEVTFKAYNPLIGKPFRTGKAMRKLPVIKEKMLRFATGEVADFNYQNLLEWIVEEPDIIQALKSLGPVRSEDKLFDALLLYNDKHSVNLPINQ